jgi:phytoene dehydrogenase-like protein
MLEDTRDSIAKFSLKDADTFGKLMENWRRMVKDILAPATYCPPEAPVDLAIAMGRTALGREVVELGERSPLDIINEYFENDRVRAIMLYVSCMWGLDPRESGVGFFVPPLRPGGDEQVLLLWRVAQVRRARWCGSPSGWGRGAENCAATNILMENGRAAGVQTDDGLTLKSKVVLSSLDPHSTFLDLVGRDNVPAELIGSIDGWKWDKWSFYTLHIVSEEPPRYKCDDPWVNDAFMTVFGIESSDQLLAHWDNVLAGRVGDNFGGHSTCESLFYPHLNRVPNQYVSFFQMHAPYDVEGGWDKRGKELEEAALAKWQRVAPNLTRDKIVMTHFETPVEIETRLPNMRRGSIKHGDYNPLQLGLYRPNAECSNSATPIEGLYVCGASTYPGALITGGPAAS